MMGLSARTQGHAPLASSARAGLHLPSVAKPKIGSRFTQMLSIHRPALPSLKMASSSRKEKAVVSASSAVVAATSAPLPVQKDFKWGADMKNLGICVAIGAITWFCPAPTGAYIVASNLHPRCGSCFNQYAGHMNVFSLHVTNSVFFAATKPQLATKS